MNIDANAVIRNMAQQVTELIIDNAILRQQLAEHEKQEAERQMKAELEVDNAQHKQNAGLKEQVKEKTDGNNAT